MLSANFLKKYFLMRIYFPFFFGLFSCSNTFNEYPPSQYLSNDQQLAILDKFIYTRYDVDYLSDKENLSALRDIYKLLYYKKISDRDYFMISYKAHFFNSGLICYAGEINIQSIDTSFNVHFTAEIPTHFSEDSVKLLFKKMIEK